MCRPEPRVALGHASLPGSLPNATADKLLQQIVPSAGIALTPSPLAVTPRAAGLEAVHTSTADGDLQDGIGCVAAPAAVLNHLKQGIL